MILSWFKRRRRERILAQPFPSTWEETLRQNMWQYALLSTDERQRLRPIAQILIAEKSWEGCDGFEITDEVKVTVAGWAALLLLDLPEHDYYHKTLSVLVYPTTFASAGRHPNPGGVVSEEGQALLGQAYYRGPVILAWDEVLREGRHRGHNNLAIHEFAHQLDMLSREADGVPPLEDTAQYRSWEAVMSMEYDHLVQAARQGRPTLLDKYGTENEAEFFAVVSECFFEMPQLMREHHDKLYSILKDYYRQDPAERLATSADY